MNIISLRTTDLSLGEEGFRRDWNTIRNSGLAVPVQIEHLKGSLIGWVRSSVGKKHGVMSLEQPLGSVAKDVEIVLAHVSNYVHDALTHGWSLEKLTSCICVTSLSECGIEL